MKKLLLACLLVFSMTQANASIEFELGDAGDNLITAQTLSTGTSSIVGSINGDSDVDLFRFGWSGGIYGAFTVTSADPMLYLFDSLGQELAFNDDHGSFLANSGDSLFVLPELASGDYYLAITSYENDALYTDGVLMGWAGFSDEGSYDYTINIIGSTTVSPVPEPSTLLLFGAGLGFFALRRKKVIVT